MPLLADRVTHPRTYAFQMAQPLRRVHGWLPDAVMDTTAKRNRRARRLLGDGDGVFARLWALPGHRLFHVILCLPKGIDFYGCGPRIGRTELRFLFPSSPAVACLAYGRCGNIHVHALVALPEGETPPAGGTYGPIYAVPVVEADHLERLALYFSRPADERAARPDLKATLRYTREELEQHRLDASEMYLEARSRLGRLPRTRWQQNIPRKFRESPQQGQKVSEQLQLHELPSPRRQRQRRPVCQDLHPEPPCPRPNPARHSLPQGQSARCFPRARSPPVPRGLSGPTVPLARKTEDLPNGPPLPATHPGQEGALPGEHLTNTLRVCNETAYESLSRQLPARGRDSDVPLSRELYALQGPLCPPTPLLRIRLTSTRSHSLS